jgi:hypothetical protein
MQLAIRLILRITIAVLVLIVGVWLLMIIESQAAVSQWSQLGGGVDDDWTFTGGPTRMILGTMPGQPSSTNADALIAAAIRLNRVPRCYRLQLGGKNLSSTDLTILINSLHLKYIHLQGVNMDSSTEDAVVNKESIQSLSISDCGSFRLIDHFLGKDTQRIVRSWDVPMAEDELRQLKTAFGKRFEGGFTKK